mmetsp:Transcript_24646/g.56454  ORF Transcript_24646/g.56454 Transcript_24646/m.56454 type:complete len:86 (-) Transcript_24646:35-292(-)
MHTNSIGSYLRQSASNDLELCHCEVDLLDVRRVRAIWSRREKVELISWRDRKLESTCASSQICISAPVKLSAAIWEGGQNPSSVA